MVGCECNTRFGRHEISSPGPDQDLKQRRDHIPYKYEKCMNTPPPVGSSRQTHDTNFSATQNKVRKSMSTMAGTIELNLLTVKKTQHKYADSGRLGRPIAIKNSQHGVLALALMRQPFSGSLPWDGAIGKCDNIRGTTGPFSWVPSRFLMFPLRLHVNGVETNYGQ